MATSSDENSDTIIEHWAFASSTCELKNSTSSVVAVSDGFSHGEVVLTVFVFLIFSLLLFGSILKPFWARQL